MLLRGPLPGRLEVGRGDRRIPAGCRACRGVWEVYVGSTGRRADACVRVYVLWYFPLCYLISYQTISGYAYTYIYIYIYIYTTLSSYDITLLYICVCIAMVSHVVLSYTVVCCVVSVTLYHIITACYAA